MLSKVSFLILTRTFDFGRFVFGIFVADAFVFMLLCFRFNFVHFSNEDMTILHLTENDAEGKTFPLLSAPLQPNEIL